MRRINIVKDSKIETKSFLVKDDLLSYLNTLNFFGVVEVFYKDKTSKTIQKILTDKIWDLNVGKSVEHSDYRFSVNSKRRVGNQLTDGTIIGAEQ